ncbi:uncharacterized protein K452DRAFT_103233 [Aplosporella prunicola CBS 121167]|uniref:Uncharacterized protein n=1 Tax=Aplosporella prunicola CBS 121167 TaxID=1176127 RepID=A0A6A6BRR9_9PEZI|nr:uncharacterized protein K452DRAFT_103233 [Aplosporella prunicola CBS 121167]KAF2145914.1 hypothetical protein K452DRAFT_103233 [Aplosporella prunicola CBS 121167]
MTCITITAFNLRADPLALPGGRAGSDLNRARLGQGGMCPFSFFVYFFLSGLVFWFWSLAGFVPACLGRSGRPGLASSFSLGATYSVTITPLIPPSHLGTPAFFTVPRRRRGHRRRAAAAAAAVCLLLVFCSCVCVRGLAMDGVLFGRAGRGGRLRVLVS